MCCNDTISKKVSPAPRNAPTKATNIDSAKYVQGRNFYHVYCNGSTASSNIWDGWAGWEHSYQCFGYEYKQDKNNQRIKMPILIADNAHVALSQASLHPYLPTKLVTAIFEAKQRDI